MNTSTKMMITLTFIAGVSGGVLSLWNGYTEPYIEQNRLAVLKAAISKVLPQYERYDEITAGETVLYIGKSTEDDVVGMAFKAKGNGFSPDLTMMVGVDPDFESITGIEILEQTETPGLGNKIEDPWFKDQFIGLIMDNQKPHVIKNTKPADPTRGIQAISGATISSKAVVDIMYEKVKEIREIYHQQTAVK